LQARLHAGGFAGICFPTEYGGLGLGYEYKKAFDAEAAGYEMPLLLNIPSCAICCATILDMGSEEQKLAHIPAALRGEEVLVQLLSEPSGGSDLAGVITRADSRDGRWFINGAKTWSTAAFAGDYGLCPARTNWDVPKHEGLTMFLVPIRHPGITMKRIRQVGGGTEFCEEFFDDVDVGDDAVVGEPGKGWEVASRQLFHERRTMGDGSEYTSGAGLEAMQDVSIDFISLLARTNLADGERDVMFMSRGKVGPFRVEGTAHPGGSGRVGVRMLLLDEGNGDKAISSAAAIFDVVGWGADFTRGLITAKARSWPRLFPGPSYRQKWSAAAAQH
jgi:hypothetical protein